MLRLSTVSLALPRGLLAIALAVVGCSKSEKKEPAPAPSGSGAAPAAGSGSGAGSGSAEAAEPVEAAQVSGPTKSATGKLEVTGLVTGSYEWIKKDQRAPISCAWDHEKEIGGVKIDVSDGAGKLLTLTLDVPPADLGPGTINVKSKEIDPPLKGAGGFSISGDEPGLFKVKFDKTKVGEKDKELVIDGTIEVTCPKKT